MSARRYSNVERKLPKPKSAPEELFALQLRVEKIVFAREHVFHPTRRWRFDFVILAMYIAVEIEGFGRFVKGQHVAGRHQRFVGATGDCEKYAEALILGWRVLRVTPAQVKSGQALGWLKALLKG